MGSLTFFNGADAPLVASTLTTTIQDDDAWPRAYRLDPLTLSERTTIGATAWDPSEAEGLGNVQRASAPDGAQVVLSGLTSSGEPGSSMRAWYRTGLDTGWQPVAGFDTGGDDTPTDVVATAQGWVATSAHRSGTTVDDVYAPRV